MDNGIAVGTPKVVYNKDITKFNDFLSIVGCSGGICGLKVAMLNRIQNDDDDWNTLNEKRC